jgi:hypothetical protein
MEIILPAAGLSTRFPNMRPKYTLTDYKGQMMFERAIQYYVGKYNVTIGILREHENKYNISKYIQDTYDKLVNIVILEERTSGPADTVYQILKQANISDDMEFFIKDCDSFFDHIPTEGNYVCVSSIADHEVLKRLASKSFVISNDQGIINNIIEKKVVSDKFCVGGYKFDKVGLYKSTFEKLKNKNVKEIFVSHIIQDCLHNNHIFTEKQITNYIDVGTAEDWFEYNDRPVIFCDIDGTLVKAQAKGTYDEQPEALEENVKVMLKYQNNGSQIIFTTARPKKYDTRTREILDSLGFKDYDLISGLQNVKRILINDYNEANPHPRAIAVNLKRDTDNLKDYI